MLAPLVALALAAAPIDPATPAECGDVRPPDDGRAVVEEPPGDARFDAVPWVIGGGFGTAGAGFALFAGAHLGAVATSALAGAPLSVVSTVAIPVVGPVLAIAQSGGVPVEFLPVALGVFGAQAAGATLLVGGAAVGAVGVGLGLVADAE